MIEVLRALQHLDFKWICLSPYRIRAISLGEGGDENKLADDEGDEIRSSRMGSIVMNGLNRSVMSI